MTRFAYRFMMALLGLISLGINVSGYAASLQPRSLKPTQHKLIRLSHSQKIQSRHQHTQMQGKKVTAKKVDLNANKNQPQPFDTHHNQLYRSYVSQGDITHIDAYTGNMSLHLPLLSIPGNDNLPLQLTLTFDNHLQRAMDLTLAAEDDYLIPGLNQLGYGWTDFVGLYNPSPNQQVPDEGYYSYPVSFYNPVFVDPTGKSHHLYFTQMETCIDGTVCTAQYQSSDNWHGVLMTDGPPIVSLYASSMKNDWVKGTIMAPNGTAYTLSTWQGANGLCHGVHQIISPNHGTTLTYQYDGYCGITRITRNDGYTVTFHNTPINTGNNNIALDRLDNLQTSDGRTWQFGYVPINVYSRYTMSYHPWTLASITLPNHTAWHFTTGTNGYNPASLSGCGPSNIFISHVSAPNGLKTDLAYGDNLISMPCGSGDNTSQFDRVAIPYVKTKTLSGAGLSTATWQYQFPKMQAAGLKLSFSTTSTEITPTERIVYTFSPDQLQGGLLHVIYPLPSPMTGTLLTKAEYALDGTLLQTTTYQWAKRTLSPTYLPFEYSRYVTLGPLLPIPSSTPLLVPLLQSKTITRGTASYRQTFSNFDSYGLPQQEVDSSPQGTKSEDLTYDENTTNGKWLIKLANVTTYDESGAIADSVVRHYDNNGNLLVESHNGVTTTYTYDSAGNKLTQTDANGHVTHFASYVAGLPQVITDPLGNVTKEVVNQNGTIATKTTPKGEATTYTYGPLYRLTGITLPTHLPTTLSWNDNANGTTMVMTRGKEVKTLQYNSLGKPVATIENDGINSHAVYRTYDSLNRLISQTYPTTVGNTGASAIDYRYDALNRPLLFTQAGNFTTTYTYDDNDNSVNIIDPNGHATSLTYRAFANPDVKQLMTIAQPEGVTTTINRTVMGQITAITQGKLTRTYAYNSHHYLSCETNPEIGSTTYGRDNVGNMTSKQVGNEKATTYTYDADNHLRTTAYTDTQGNAQTLTRRYDADGHLITVTNSGDKSSWAYTYDANGNVISAVLSGGPKPFAFTTTYDGYDHIAAKTFADGTNLAYTVTPMGRITQIKNRSNAEVYLNQITYFPDNHIQAFVTGNGTVTTYTENNRDMRNSIVVKKGATTLLDKQYTYDGVGNIISIVDNVKANNSQAMAYDGLNRLINAKGVWGAMQLAYDTNSNIISKQIGNAVSTYHYNGNDQLTSICGANAQTMATQNGNMTHLGNLQLAYNTLQQVEAIGGTGLNHVAVNDHYTYDGNGHRVSVIQDGNTHYEAYNQKAQLLYKDNPATDTQDAYIHLGGQTVVHLKTKAGTTTPIYLHSNLLGSTLVATDQNGQTKWTENYKPYGDELIKNKDRDNPHVGYTGKPHDDDTGLSYYGARFYDPAIGRFISPDPHPIVPTKPITFNRYAYAADNPYKYKDPTGKFFVTALVGGVIGGIAGGLDGYFSGGGIGAITKGAAIGFGVGAAVGFVDPMASEAAADMVVARTGSSVLANTTRVATSISVNTAGNMGYNVGMHGEASPLSALVGALGGYGAGVGVNAAFSKWSSGGIRTGLSEGMNDVMRGTIESSADKIGEMASEKGFDSAMSSNTGNASSVGHGNTSNHSGDHDDGDSSDHDSGSDHDH